MDKNFLKERYNITPNPVALDMENAYEVIARNIGAIRLGEIDYEKVSNKIINDVKNAYIKGVVFDHEL